VFPAPLPQIDTDEFLRCRDPRPHSDKRPDDRSQDSRADTNLAQEVDSALWNAPVLRALDFNNIDIRVRDGMVGLYGHVASMTNRREAENAVRSVDGVRGFVNGIIADDRLLLEVATSLGSLEHRYGCKFFTGVSHGVVILSGMVDDTNKKLVAEQCAASNPGVRGVINRVQVRGGGLDMPELPFLQPHIGAEFHFLDGISGKVERVIIDPDNRRVAAMTLRGQFTDRQREPKSLDGGSARQPERALVLPMTTVRFLTKDSGFLNIRYPQSNEYSEFNADDFALPPQGWMAPYPYCRADVLFPAERADGAMQIPDQVESPIAVALAHQVLKDQLLENDSLGG
jgi:hypothetical protein